MKLSPFPSVIPYMAASVAPLPFAENMPEELKNYCSELEAWALANQRDARNDSIRFWILKAPAIASSAVSGILAFLHWDMTAASLAAVASACVLIDAVNPGGQLRNAHLRSVHEIRELEGKVVNDWRIGDLSGKSNQALAAGILTSAQKVRERISKDLIAAETSFARTGRHK